MRRLAFLNVAMLATAHQQISLTDPDADLMAISGRGSGVVGYYLLACGHRLAPSPVPVVH
jgi:hypothetical protein